MTHNKDSEQDPNLGYCGYMAWARTTSSQGAPVSTAIPIAHHSFLFSFWIFECVNIVDFESWKTCLASPWFSLACILHFFILFIKLVSTSTQIVCMSSRFKKSSEKLVVLDSGHTPTTFKAELIIFWPLGGRKHRKKLDIQQTWAKVIRNNRLPNNCHHGATYCVILVSVSLIVCLSWYLVV